VQLDKKLGAYEGHISDFDISLYRGAYQLQNLIIKKKGGMTPPILTVGEIDLSLAWRALLKKEISGDITIDRMNVQFIDSKDADQKQLGREEKTQTWKDVLNTLIPISIESLKVRNSSLYFANTDLKDSPPVRLENVDLSVADLRTHEKNVESPFHLSALLQNHANLIAQGRIDILANPIRGSLDYKVANFRVSTINTILRAYIPIDLTSGTLSVYGETTLKGDEATGYSNVFLKEGDVIAPSQQFLSAKHFFIEILAGLANAILKNRHTKELAAHIPFHYKDKKMDIKTSDIVWSAVKNSTHPIPVGWDHSIE
jgi:hypothetical protein